MPRLPDGFPYRRKAWDRVLRKRGHGFPSLYDPVKHRWIPETHIRLLDAVDLFGHSKMDEWSGNERNASNPSKAPDPPWEWYLVESPTEYFIFSEGNELQYTDEQSALKWWEEIEPILLKEMVDEKSAYKRWKDCVNRFRNSLASGEFESFVLSQSGELHAIRASAWRSSKADDFMTSETAEIVTVSGLAQVVGSGPILLRHDFLTASDNDCCSGAGLEPSGSTIDQTRFPYLVFLLRAAREAPIDSAKRTPKKVIKHWLQQNWPSELGKPTESKLNNLASFLRRPEDERGGLS